MASKLKSLSLSGFKTYREISDLEFGPVTVLVGGNGSGKSNLLSFFELLRRMMSPPGELQLAVSEAGGAGRLLHDGPKATTSIQARMALEIDSEAVLYGFSLIDTANDSFRLRDEEWKSTKRGAKSSGRESRLHQEHMFIGILPDDETPFRICDLFRQSGVHQFHDTSAASGLRRKSSVGDSVHLHRDGSNLAAFLHRLSEGGDEARRAFARIQETLRLVLPFFAEFILLPEHDSILLRWREVGSEQVFSASQASDGMLRLMALVTLLCQPPETLPPLLILDEPELGLHPEAIALVAALVRQASQDCQVIVATQSVPFVDEFSLDEIVVVGRSGRESTLTRPKAAEYAEWIEEYSTGEIWRKNLVGGGPGR